MLGEEDVTAMQLSIGQLLVLKRWVKTPESDRASETTTQTSDKDPVLEEQFGEATETPSTSISKSLFVCDFVEGLPVIIVDCDTMVCSQRTSKLVLKMGRTQITFNGTMGLCEKKYNPEFHVI